MDFSAEILRLLEKSQLNGVALQSVGPSEIESPYRELLVHERDMTSTLASFHGADIVLKVLKTEKGKERYLREVILYAGEKPVEYGLIEVQLENCRSDVRERILGEKEPLGGILNDSKIRYESCPLGFVKIAPEQFSPDFFPSAGSEAIFGRYNTLLDESGQLIARILEILPREQS